MLHRVLAVFLAFVLLWSGLGTADTAAASVPMQQQALADGAAPTAPDQEPARDQALDGVPAQAQADSTGESPGLLPAPLKPGAATLALVRSAAFRLDAWCAPVLAGPLRPPCQAGLAA